MFIVNGISLDSDDAKRAIKAWKLVVWAAVMILGITPLIAWLIVRLPLLAGMDSALGTGFVLFNAMPTTLSSGVSLVRQAKGNHALALIITITTNILVIHCSSSCVIPSVLTRIDVCLRGYSLRHSHSRSSFQQRG